MSTLKIIKFVNEEAETTHLSKMSFFLIPAGSSTGGDLLRLDGKHLSFYLAAFTEGLGGLRRGRTDGSAMAVAAATQLQGQPCFCYLLAANCKISKIVNETIKAN